MRLGNGYADSDSEKEWERDRVREREWVNVQCEQNWSRFELICLFVLSKCIIFCAFVARHYVWIRDMVVCSECERTKHANNYYYYRNINPHWWLYSCVRPWCIHAMPFHVRRNICDRFEYFPFLFFGDGMSCTCGGRSGCLCSDRTHSVMHIEFQYCMIEIMHYLFTSCGRDGKTVRPNHGKAVAHIYTLKKDTHITRSTRSIGTNTNSFILFFFNFCGARAILATSPRPFLELNK